VAATPSPPAALGLHPRHRLTGGHRNTVWLCDGPDGVVVAKSTRRTEAQLRWLAPLHTAARAAGFLVPALHSSTSGQLLQHGWTLEDWVEGTFARPSDMPALAARLRAFHALCPSLPQRPGFATLADLMTLTRGGDIDLTVLPETVLFRLRSAWAAVASGPTQAIHGDLGPGNLLLTASGPCLIDWDEARVDFTFLDLVHATDLPPAELVAHCALEIASCWQAEPDRAHQLLATLCSGGNTAG
jgi:aminoglycoside phosphotransferase (APT) family kinase protein